MRCNHSNLVASDDSKINKIINIKILVNKEVQFLVFKYIVLQCGIALIKVESDQYLSNGSYCNGLVCSHKPKII